MKLAAAMFSSLLIVAAIPSAPLDDACNKCQPAAAAWDWKANGYAIGADAASAHDGAKQDSIASGCKTAAKYIEGRKLSCKAGCDAGALEETCDASQAPSCQQGSYASDKGMWTFVCRKVRQKALKQKQSDVPACDEALAATQPGFGMCDTHVRAHKTLACSSPNCG